MGRQNLPNRTAAHIPVIEVHVTVTLKLHAVLVTYKYVICVICNSLGPLLALSGSSGVFPGMSTD